MCVSPQGAGSCHDQPDGSDTAAGAEGGRADSCQHVCAVLLLGLSSQSCTRPCRNAGSAWTLCAHSFIEWDRTWTQVRQAHADVEEVASGLESKGMEKRKGKKGKERRKERKGKGERNAAQLWDLG